MLLTLIMPVRIILFSVHNYLTKRDYTIQLDDYCDFGIVICVFTWIAIDANFSQYEPSELEYALNLIDSRDDKFAFQIMNKSFN